MGKVLLLEPDSVLGSTYRSGLEYAGHSVEVCSNAQSAVQSMDAFKPDIIIAELQLAMHNGIEFLYELRSYTDWQDIPVVVLSHLPNLERGLTQALWEQIRIAAYHYKPLTKLSDLILSIEKILAPVS